MRSARERGARGAAALAGGACVRAIVRVDPEAAPVVAAGAAVCAGATPPLRLARSTAKNTNAMAYTAIAEYRERVE